MGTAFVAQEVRQLTIGLAAEMAQKRPLIRVDQLMGPQVSQLREPFIGTIRAHVWLIARMDAFVDLETVLKREPFATVIDRAHVSLGPHPLHTTALVLQVSP